MFGQEDAAITREEEEETGKEMSGDDFDIREVLKRGRFYNILLLLQLKRLSPNMNLHMHLKPI